MTLSLRMCTQVGSLNPGMMALSTSMFIFGRPEEQGIKMASIEKVPVHALLSLADNVKNARLNAAPSGSSLTINLPSSRQPGRRPRGGLHNWEANGVLHSNLCCTRTACCSQQRIHEHVYALFRNVYQLLCCKCKSFLERLNLLLAIEN